ncbi:MAG: 3'-5' exonuclease [Desulfobacterales bacterium]|nr:3'-5' exonuclease [Desulfobacterales bacterium]
MFGRSKPQPPMDWETRFSRLAYESRDPGLKAFYRAFRVQPHTPVSQVSFLALDLETTGLDPEKDAIVSIGFISHTYNRISCSNARNWTIRPYENPEDPMSTIHGITHTHLETSPGFADTLVHLLKAMAGHVIVAHYCRIEREFLNKATMDLIGEPLEFPAIDTMELESRKHPVYRPNFIQRWMGDKNSPSLRLSHARERYGLPRYRPHHALTDALATAELFMAQVADRFSPDTPVCELWR